MTEMTSQAPYASGGKDTRPWYRYFWPWFIIALPASVVVAGIATLIIAIAHEDSLVVDDYYRRGLGINQVLAADETASRLRLSAELNLDVQSRVVTLLVTGREPVEDETLVLRLTHPTDSSRDLSLSLYRTELGYRGEFERDIHGRHYLQLEGEKPEPWLLRAEVTLPIDGREQWQLEADN